MSERRNRLPFHIDAAGLVFEEYAVVDVDYRLVQVFDTEEKAEAFVAQSNGSDVAKVRDETARLGRMLAQYRENLRRGSRRNQ